jgi:hypothetical protein
VCASWSLQIAGASWRSASHSDDSRYHIQLIGFTAYSKINSKQE